jgi:hypothetical protein
MAGAFTFAGVLSLLAKKTIAWNPVPLSPSRTFTLPDRGHQIDKTKVCA